MLITQPYPGEYCLGHIGRLGRLNDLSSVNEAVIAIQRISNQGLLSKDKVSGIASVAQQCGIPTELYIHDHSFLAYLSFTHCNSVFWDRTMQNRRALAIPSPRPPQLCEQCAEDDLRMHGVSYWRLTHQFPGIHWCIKHDVLLRISPTKEDFFQRPHRQLKFSEPSLTSLGEHYSNLPNYLVRFHLVVDLMVKCDFRLNRQAVKLALWQRLCDLGQHDKNFTEINKTSFLSDLVISIFPMDWLANVFPSIQKKRKRQTFALIDSAILDSSWTAPSSAAIAIFLAIFFDNPSDAFDYLLSTSQELSPCDS